MWPTCGSSVMRRDISKNAQSTTLKTLNLITVTLTGEMKVGREKKK